MKKRSKLTTALLFTACLGNFVAAVTGNRASPCSHPGIPYR